MKAHRTNKDIPDIALKIVNEIKDYLENIIHDKLKKIILFGSYASNKFEKESDIDILILADLSESELSGLNEEINLFIVDLSLKYNLVVNPVLKNTDTFYGFSELLPFYNGIVKEGITIYG